jgi:hypothetical protein
VRGYVETDLGSSELTKYSGAVIPAEEVGEVFVSFSVK